MAAKKPEAAEPINAHGTVTYACATCQDIPGIPVRVVNPVDDVDNPEPVRCGGCGTDMAVEKVERA